MLWWYKFNAQTTTKDLEYKGFYSHFHSFATPADGDYNFKKNFNISRTDVNLIVQEETMKAIKFHQKKKMMQPKKIYGNTRIMTKHIYKSLLITDSKHLPATVKV